MEVPLQLTVWLETVKRVSPDLLRSLAWEELPSALNLPITNSTPSRVGTWVRSFKLPDRQLLFKEMI